MVPSEKLGRALFAALVLAVCAFFSGAAHSETRAILIGVADYDDASGIADLEGPVNDVLLMASVLNAKGVTDITRLTDGIAGVTRPTRAAILAAFADLTIRARLGDLIYIHMSGHGTRQRDQSGDETDGLDEVFLPSDVLPAERGTGIIRNALIDDEIGAIIDALRAKGADVWFVLDSCHSGSGVRAGETGVRTRFVDPRSLGVGDGRVTAGDQAFDFEQSLSTDLPGGLLAFYSARSDELAREIDFSGDGSGWYGLFTAKLAGRLDGSEGLTYRRLFQAILADLADADIPASARLQTPSWEGTFIDAPVLGGSAALGIRQYQFRLDEVFAGRVHGIRPGAVLSLHTDATDPEDRSLGLAQVTDVEALRAYVAPVDVTCRALADALCPRSGTLPNEAKFARIVASPMDLLIRFSPVLDPDTGMPTSAKMPAVEAFEALVRQAPERWTINRDSHDILVSLAGDGLRFSRAPGETGLVSQATPDSLRAVMTRIEQAERLAAALDAISDAPALFARDNPLALQAEVATSAMDDLFEPGMRLDAQTVRRECGSILRGNRFDPFTPIEDTDGALKQCDQVALTAQGTSPGSLDVNRVHIDAQFCIWSDYELIEGFATSRMIGDPMVLCSDCPDGPSAGAERLYVLTTESRANAEALRLDGIVENCGGQTRSAAAYGALDYLETLAATGATRGVMSGLGGADIWIDRYRWQVLPRSEAFARAGRGSSSKP